MTITPMLDVFRTQLERYDKETYIHSENVARSVMLIGLSLGLSSTDIELLYWSGFLHDFGKTLVDKVILLKSERLTKGEYEVIMTHPALGADQLEMCQPRSHSQLKAIAEGVRYHHECFDGTGYPYGLASYDIPLYGRIVAVADTFDALTHKRPYRNAQSVDSALSYLYENIGTHYEFNIVSTFASLVVNDNMRNAR